MEEEETDEVNQGPAPKRKRRKTATTNPPKQRKARTNATQKQPQPQQPLDEPPASLEHRIELAGGHQIIPNSGLLIHDNEGRLSIFLPFAVMSAPLQAMYQQAGSGFAPQMASQTTAFAGYGGFEQNYPTPPAYTFQPTAQPGQSQETPVAGFSAGPGRVFELDGSETMPPVVNRTDEALQPPSYTSPDNGFIFGDDGGFGFQSMNWWD
ncbi:hypothetical protein ACHAPJ_013102 [Fusarium lateritium]